MKNYLRFKRYCFSPALLSTLLLLGLNISAQEYTAQLIVDSAVSGIETIRFDSGSSVDVKGETIVVSTSSETRNFKFSEIKSMKFEKHLITGTKQTEPAGKTWVYVAGTKLRVVSPSMIEKIEIFSTTGRLMKIVKPGKTFEETIDVSAFSRGAYLVKMNGVTVEKIVL